HHLRPVSNLELSVNSLQVSHSRREGRWGAKNFRVGKKTAPRRAPTSKRTGNRAAPLAAVRCTEPTTPAPRPRRQACKTKGATGKMSCPRLSNVGINTGSHQPQMNLSSVDFRSVLGILPTVPLPQNCVLGRRGSLRLAAAPSHSPLATRSAHGYRSKNSRRIASFVRGFARKPSASHAAIVSPRFLNNPTTLKLPVGLPAASN